MVRHVMPIEIVPEEIAYKWLEAARSYEQTIESGTIVGLSVSEYWEKIGFCYDFASRQALSLDDFKSLRHNSADSYKKAAMLYGNESLDAVGKNAQNLANAEYVLSWLANDCLEKMQALDKCRILTKEALKAFKEVGDEVKYGQTANLLSKCLIDRLYLSSAGDLDEISREAIENSEDAISVLSKLDQRDDLLIAFALASVQCLYIANLFGTEEMTKSMASKSVTYSENAAKLSDQIGGPYDKAIVNWSSALSSMFFNDVFITAISLTNSICAGQNSTDLCSLRLSTPSQTIYSPL